VKTPPFFDDPDTRELVTDVCKEFAIDDLLLRDLCEVLADYSGSGRRFGLPEDITQVIDRFIDRTKEAE